MKRVPLPWRGDLYELVPAANNNSNVSKHSRHLLDEYVGPAVQAYT